MIISHRHTFVILAAWKTASSTIKARLGHLNESPYHGFYDWNPHLNRVVHQHLTYADFCALPEGRFNYFIASFVRNPYDRVYSGFQQLQKDLSEQPTAEFPKPWIRQLVMDQLNENLAQLTQAGFDFDRWLASVSEAQVYEAGRNTSFPLHPCHYWTHIDGTKRVHFIGRVEQFEADFERLCGRLGVEVPARVNANVFSDEQDILPNGYKYIGKMRLSAISCG